MQMYEKEISSLEKTHLKYNPYQGYVYVATTDTGITKVGATANIKGRIFAIKEWFRRAGFGNVIKYSFSHKHKNYFKTERKLHHILKNYRWKIGEIYTLPYEEILKIAKEVETE